MQGKDGFNNLIFKKMKNYLEDGLLNLGIEAAFENLKILCEKEADKLCGAPRGKHSDERSAYRHGYTDGEVYLGGIKHSFSRPRVRSEDGDLTLTVYEKAQDPKAFNKTVLSQCFFGLSQRDYAPAQKVLLGRDGEGISKSTISRRFIEGTQKILDELLQRELKKEYLTLFLDGKEFGGRTVICALGVTVDGEKELLGLWEGVTENKDVCMGLILDLVERGFNVDDGLLVITDGGKGLKAAIDEIWGDRVSIQRCRLHKKRNVKEHLPDKEHDWVIKKMNTAFDKRDPKTGKEILINLADALQSQNRISAANSLREGLDELFTVDELRISEKLLSSFSNTNIIESAFSLCEQVSGRVKRWRNGNQVLRWMALGCMKAEDAFNNIEDKGGLRELRIKLRLGAEPGGEFSVSV